MPGIRLVQTVITTAISIVSISARQAPHHSRRDDVQRRANADASSKFQWSDIEPSENLQYTPCFGDFQCARLQVPLDWNNTNPGLVDTLSIAIVRLPAQVSVTDPRYGGPVLINPGGPGDGGVDYALQSGTAIQTILDAAYVNGSSTYVANISNARYFDIIGFDPRGVGSTTPFLACSSNQIQQFAYQQNGNNGIPGTIEGPLDLLWARTVASNQNCFAGPAITPNGTFIANFIDTTSVARDMVEIVERHGEWLQDQSEGMIKWQPGEEPIQYFGESYGTVLGAVVAAMQPHRIRRMILDGVASSSSYFAGNITQDILQAGATFDQLFEYCALAGPDLCGLWAGNSTANISSLLQSIFDDLEQNGPIPAATPDGPQVITLSDLKLLSLISLYQPLASFELYAAIVGPLAQRNGTLCAQYKSTPLAQPSNVTYDPYNASTNSNLNNVEIAITGSDAELRFAKASQFVPVWHAAQNSSHWTGDAWAGNYMGQFSWPRTPKWRFSDQHAIASNVTASPILFASNLIDGVTSLQSARQMSAAFTGSGLLLVDGVGHTTSNAPSLRAAQKMREYFQTGKLPSGLEQPCLPYARPFLGEDGPNTAPFNVTGASMENIALYNATMGLL